MRTIQLSRGYSTLVSDSTFEELNMYKWHAIIKKNGVYAASSKVGYMHRFILRAEFGVEIDHIDRNTLNNQTTNLRLVTHSQNGYNKRVINKRSGYKGVWPHRRKWQAIIGSRANRKFLGSFITQEEAALAYNDAAEKLYGKYACLNIIGGVNEPNFT